MSCFGLCGKLKKKVTRFYVSYQRFNIATSSEPVKDLSGFSLRPKTEEAEEFLVDGVFLLQSVVFPLQCL